MADNDSEPKGLEALLQTLSPKKRKVFLSIIENDPRAALGANLVGKRAFGVKETHNKTHGWTHSRMWGDITFKAEPPGSPLKNQERILLKNARESLEGRGVPPKNSLTAAEKLLYREGIIQPFVVYGKNQKYGSFFEEMLTLAHELGHVADAWQTEHRAGVDDEFSGEAGLPREQVFKNLPPDPLRPFAIGVADYMYHGHPDMIGFGERYKTNPKIRDEPYQRLMDRYNRETLSRQYPNQKGIYPSFSTEKDAYIPDRYSSSIIKGVTGRDPFANVWSAIPSDAAAHPAQAGALMELNRRLGRDPLEGMDEWMRKHGRPRAKEEF
jgi:hypothetical protein